MPGHSGDMAPGVRVSGLASVALALHRRDARSNGAVGDGMARKREKPRRQAPESLTDQSADPARNRVIRFADQQSSETPMSREVTPALFNSRCESGPLEPAWGGTVRTVSVPPCVRHRRNLIVGR